jgi:hypothetical protein
MPELHAVSPSTFATRRWKRYSSHAFAAHDALAPLVAHELPRAALHLPIAFVAQGGALTPVAVLGIRSGQNLFVAPDGRWLGGYTPAAYRAYPFALAPLPDGQQVLAFDESSGLLAQAGGEPFFEADGSPAEGVKEVLAFLTQVQANRVQTARICKVLADHALLQPWPITVQGDGSEHTVQGLLRVDEAALNALPADALKAVQQAGALPVVYCQLLSVQHLPRLGALAQARRTAALATVPTTPGGDLDLGFLERNGTFSFGAL